MTHIYSAWDIRSVIKVTIVFGCMLKNVKYHDLKTIKKRFRDALFSACLWFIYSDFVFIMFLFAYRDFCVIYNLI